MFFGSFETSFIPGFSRVSAIRPPFLVQLEEHPTTGEQRAPTITGSRELSNRDEILIIVHFPHSL